MAGIYAPIKSMVSSPMVTARVQSLPRAGLLFYLRQPNASGADSGKYILLDATGADAGAVSIRAATGWMSGTANLFYDAGGASVAVSSADIQAWAGINQYHILYSEERGLVVYDPFTVSLATLDKAAKWMKGEYESGVIARCNPFISSIGTLRDLQPLRYIQGPVNLTHASIVGTETVTKPDGTTTAVVSAGKVTVGTGTLWNLVLSNGSVYSGVASALTATTGIVWDSSGNGRHLLFTVADSAVVCGSGTEFGTDTLNLDGWTLSDIKHHADALGVTQIPIGTIVPVLANLSGACSFAWSEESATNPIVDISFVNGITGNFLGTAVVTGSPVFDDMGVHTSSGKYIDIQMLDNVDFHEGSVVLEVVSASTNTGTAIPISLGETSNPAYKGAGGNQATVQSLGGQTGGPVWANDGLPRVLASAWSLQAGKQRISVDGSSPVETANFTYKLQSSGALRIGSRQDGLYQWVGSIKSLRLYNKAMTSSELSVASTPRGLNIIAHRGYSGVAPQNTIEAFTLAISEGATWLETDMQVSSDGVVVLIHDNTVDATTDGTGAVASLTSTYLRSLDAGSSFNISFAGAKIPLLSEYIALSIANPLLTLCPEIKGYRSTADIALMVQEFIDAGVLSRTVFQSFTWSDLAMVRSIAPTARVLFLGDSSTVATIVPAAISAGNSYVGLDYASLLANTSLITQAKAAGIGIALWTVDTWANVIKLARLGVTDIMSNWPINLLRTK